MRVKKVRDTYADPFTEGRFVAVGDVGTVLSMVRGAKMRKVHFTDGDRWYVQAKHLELTNEPETRSQWARNNLQEMGA